MSRTTSLQVFLSDVDGAPVSRAEVYIATGNTTFELKPIADGVFAGDDLKPGPFTLTVKPGGRRLRGEEREIVLTPGPNSVLVSLGGRGDLSYPSADGEVHFRGREDAMLLAVREEEDSKDVLDDMLAEFGLRRIDEDRGEDPTRARDSDFVMVELPDGLRNAGQQIDALISRMRRHRVEIIPGAIIQRGKEAPLQGLTNQMLVRFGGEVGDDVAIKIFREYNLRVLRTVTYAGNAYLVERSGSPDYDILKLAEELNRRPEVEYAEPQILQELELDAFTPNDTLYNLQNHLPLINADDAWDTLDDISVNLRGGSPNTCIAVFDPHGVAPNHPDLTANLTDGTSKMLTSFNFRTMTAQTVGGLGGDHGTQVAGTATANFSNALGVAGVAPNCRLIGGRIPNPATGIEMADAFIWAAGFNTGNTNPGFPAVPTQPADVIANSWGVSNAALSNAMRDCLDFLTVYGRGGRGCVVTFSTGNLGHVQFTNIRRFASYERTIAVGASINTNPTTPVNSFHPDPNGNTNNLTATADRRAFYNPFGPEMDIVAPSHTCYLPVSGNVVDPTTSTVRVGTGALNGATPPAVANDYATSFGGTSHASPTIAGAAALVISTDPTLNWVQVREILRTTAVRIDNGNTDPTGQYVDNDGDGTAEFSQWYGYGRVNVDAAVIAARDGAFASDVVVRENLGDTGTVPSPGWHAASPDIWVRATNDPIPALAYGANPPHQNAVRGQDNFIFARVRNTGVATASEVYLRAMICHYPGFEFRYPEEFIPSIRPGDPVPNPLVPGTYLIGEVRVDDLLPGEDRIVKMTWPQALVPPATVTVGGSTVNWHPCLLLEASPHDGPVAPAASAIDIRRINNICQRNIGIDDPSAGGDNLYGIIGGFLSGGRTRSIVVDLSKYRGRSEVLLRLVDPKIMERLLVSVKRGDVKTDLDPLGDEEQDQKDPILKTIRSRSQEPWDGSLRFPSGAVMELELADRRTLEMILAPKTRLRIRDDLIRRTSSVDITSFRGDTYVALKPGGVYELPVMAGEGQLFPVIVGCPKGAEGGSEIRITQRRSDGALSAGYAIRA